jgi:hypothetical protein
MTRQRGGAGDQRAGPQGMKSWGSKRPRLRHRVVIVCRGALPRGAFNEKGCAQRLASGLRLQRRVRVHGASTHRG